MDPRALLAALAMVVAGCGGGGGGAPAAVAAAPVVAPAVTPPVTPPVVTPPVVTPAPPVVVCTPFPYPVIVATERAKLAHWFTGPLTGKTIAWVGDSTTLHMSPANQSGAAGLNDYYLDTYVRPAAGVLNGTLQAWMGLSGYSTGFFNTNGAPNTKLAEAIALHADLYIVSFGINDVRTGEYDQAGVASQLRISVNAIRAALPNADIVLRMPNSLLSVDQGAHYLLPNTAAAAQTYTDAMRGAYRTLATEWPNVAMYDSQARLFGEVALASSPIMGDQIHPNVIGYRKVFDQIVDIIGAAPPPTCI